MHSTSGRVGADDPSDAAVAVMDDLAVLAEKAERDWQEWADGDGLEAEH